MQWHHPSPRLWTARRLVIGLLFTPLLIAAAVLTLLGPGAWGAACIFAVLLLAATAWVVERGRYRAWAYCERESDLLVQRGLLLRQLSVVPYGRMQFIDVTAGPVDRLFDLATVQLHTAAAATDARIPGLRSSDAAQLRDRLAAVGEAGATGL